MALAILLIKVLYSPILCSPLLSAFVAMELSLGLYFFMCSYLLITERRLVQASKTYRPVFHITQEQITSARNEVVEIPDGWSHRHAWLPIYYKRTPYNEDEIVGLINDIVRDFIRLSYISNDGIIWAPEGGHVLNETLCDELNVSETARALIRHLPCPKEGGINLFGGSALFFITEDSGLRNSRDYLYDEGYGLILPQDVILAVGDRESSYIILDTEENTIRVVPVLEGIEDVNPPNTPLEYPGKHDHYRNYWARHAPSWLRVQRNQIRALDIIPPGIWEHDYWYIDYESEWMRRKLKYIIEGTYGWPDEFDQAAWDRDRERIWYEIDEEYNKLGRPQVLRFL